MIQIKNFVFNLFSENTYLVWNQDKDCAIIDPGCKDADEKAALHSFIESEGLHPAVILLTHGHLDHVYGVRNCADKYGIPVLLHPLEEAVTNGFNKQFPVQLGVDIPEDFAFRPIDTKEPVTLGDITFKVLPTPGHSPGGVCFLIEEEKVLFSGDTLFAGSIGRTDNSWASYEHLMDSLHNVLMKLDGDIDVLPGHGRATSIGKERVSNPFVYEDFDQNDLMPYDEDEKQ